MKGQLNCFAEIIVLKHERIATQNPTKLDIPHHSNCNKCMRKLSSDTNICALISSQGIETLVVQNHTDNDVRLRVVPVNHNHHKISVELLDICFPSLDRFSSRFGKCSCDPEQLEKKEDGKGLGLQFHVTLSKQMTKSTKQVVVKLVKRLMKMACSKRDRHDIDVMQVKVETSTSSQSKRRVTVKEEEEPFPALKVYWTGNKMKDFKAGVEDIMRTTPVPPAGHGKTA